MLKNFILVGLTFIVMSCGKDKTGYHITAVTDGIKDSTKVFLNLVENKRLKVIDTTLIINDAFTFTGNIDAKDVHFITIENIRSSVALILENDDIDITVYKDSLYVSKVTGTEENKLLQEYSNYANNIGTKVRNLRQEYSVANRTKDSAKIAEGKIKFDSILNTGSEYDLKFINENINSLMGVFILERIFNNKSQTAKTVKELFDKLPESSKQSRSGKNIAENLSKALATAEGSVAPNFSAPTPNGELLALNDIKGTVTIIDFWAAWCGPCRKENPNVVNVYNKYHDKGLEIIGVSLDGNTRQQDPKAAWLKAIEDDKLPWHHVSNLKYFNDDIAKLYNITSIPATFILDSEGVIIAKNLRGKALDDKIAELLN